MELIKGTPPANLIKYLVQLNLLNSQSKFYQLDQYDNDFLTAFTNYRVRQILETLVVLAYVKQTLVTNGKDVIAIDKYSESGYSPVYFRF